MKLTDNEKREILKLIEVDKPLPDKYRFMLFDDKREVELVWNGKTSEVTNIVLPFQVIEQVDEPRKSKPLMDANTRESGKSIRGHSRSFAVKNNPDQLLLFDFRGRQKSGWNNKLIWGDNKLILASLKNGHIREEIEKAGGIKLIYIDPPFDVGADFSMDIEIGDPSTGSGQAETFTKKPGVLEELAYRDTWGKGADSFIAMIYERLVLMRDLLAEDGSIYVHCDWRVSGYLRLVLDEIFGSNAFKNKVVWKRSAIATNVNTQWRNSHDELLFFGKTENTIFNVQYGEYSESSKKHFSQKDENGYYQPVPLLGSGKTISGETGEVWRGIDPNKQGKNGMHWLRKPSELEKLDKEGKIYWPPNGGTPRLKYYLSLNQKVFMCQIYGMI